MPATSIDTFFACSLMVLLVLSAMATTSKLLYPYIEGTGYRNVIERYRALSKDIILSNGVPSDWGKDTQTSLTAFGLARAGSATPYDLDIDKVSRLNSENAYAFDYAEAFTALRMPDISFRIEIKPVFDVAVNPTEVYVGANQTTYEFAIITDKNDKPIETDLRVYVVADGYAEANNVLASDGSTNLNVTLSNTVSGPAILVAFARSTYDPKQISFETHAFAHNAASPVASEASLKLSPLDCILTVMLAAPNVTMSEVYAFTYGYNATLTMTANSGIIVTYAIAEFADPSPLVIVATGRNSTAFFTQQTAYPQVPMRVGASLAGPVARTDVFAFTYAVSIRSVVYECTMWLGGPRHE